MIASLALLLAAGSLTYCADAVKPKHLLSRLKGVDPEPLAQPFQFEKDAMTLAGRAALGRNIQPTKEQSSIAPMQETFSQFKEEAMPNANISDSDVLDLNVGGVLMSTRRSTFLAAPASSFLYASFSGDWPPPKAKDSEGRIFLDFTPRLFGLILSYLRTCSLSEPGTVDLPTVPKEDSQEFTTMLNFLGLVGLESTGRLPSDKCTVSLAMRNCYGNARVETSDAGTSLTKDVSGAPSETGDLTFLGDAAFVSQHPLAEQPCAWRIKIDNSFMVNHGMHVGIGVIGNPSPTKDSFHDNTSYMWASRQVYMNGQGYGALDGWDGWRHGDIAIIKFDANRGSLKMYHIRHRKTFEIRGVSGAQEWRIHIHFDGVSQEHLENERWSHSVTNNLAPFYGLKQVTVTEATSAEAELVERV